MKQSEGERFDNLTIPEPNTGCFLWTAAVDRQGYGRFTTADRQKVSAHRFAFARAHGPIAHGLHVCHRCDTPACVNPDHMFAGTAQDNVRDAVAKGRHVNPGISTGDVCAKGHPRIPENTYEYRQRGKVYLGCRVCRRERQ